MGFEGVESNCGPSSSRPSRLNPVTDLDSKDRWVHHVDVGAVELESEDL